MAGGERHGVTRIFRTIAHPIQLARAAKFRLLTLYDMRPGQALEGTTSVERPPRPRLPEGGFYYPFQGPRLRLGATQEMQHPRTVSAGAPTCATLGFMSVSSSDRRATDVRSLSLYQGKAGLVGESEKRRNRWAMERRGLTTSGGLGLWR